MAASIDCSSFFLENFPYVLTSSHSLKSFENVSLVLRVAASIPTLGPHTTPGLSVRIGTVTVAMLGWLIEWCDSICGVKADAVLVS